VSLSDIDVNGSIQTHLIVAPARNEAENPQRLRECLVFRVDRSVRLAPAPRGLAVTLLIVVRIARM
jgi:hypothetical protein